MKVKGDVSYKRFAALRLQSTGHDDNYVVRYTHFAFAQQFHASFRGTTFQEHGSDRKSCTRLFVR